MSDDSKPLSRTSKQFALAASVRDVKVYVGNVPCAVSASNYSNPAAGFNVTIPEIVAGALNMTVRVDSPGVGYMAWLNETVQVSPVTGQTYNYVHHPVIYSLSTQTSGLLGGEVLTIHGTGFDPVAANNVVLAAGSSCVVLTSTLNSISCVLGAGVEQHAPVNAGTGQAIPVFGGGRGLYNEVGVAALDVASAASACW